MNELGEWLRHARESRGLTLADAERDTRISRRYLQALETGDLDVIPAPVYARGFLRSYAQYLGLDPQEAMARYPRDDGPGPYQPPQPQRLQRQSGRPQREPSEPRSPRQASPSPFGSRQAPPPAQEGFASRPEWRRPGPGVSTTPPEVDDYRNNVSEVLGEEAGEPMIGADIATPVPARRLQQDPAAQTRSMTVLVVAVVAVVAILIAAFTISNLGGDDNGDGANSPIPTTEAEGEAPADEALTPETPDTSPEGITGTGMVPAVVGMDEADAISAIEAAGLVPNLQTFSSDEPVGTVIDQAPAADTQMVPGDPVTIVVSEGP